MPCSVTTRSASALGVVTIPSASLATMRERVRSRSVDCSAVDQLSRHEIHDVRFATLERLGRSGEIL
jgi:hypothetical protein